MEEMPRARILTQGSVQRATSNYFTSLLFTVGFAKWDVKFKNMKFNYDALQCTPIPGHTDLSQQNWKIKSKIFI